MKTLDYEGLTVKRKGRGWVVAPIEDEVLTRRQMLILLLKVLRVSIEEIALMDVEFRANPTATLAHFGIHGKFLYCE